MRTFLFKHGKVIELYGFFLLVLFQETSEQQQYLQYLQKQNYQVNANEKEMEKRIEGSLLAQIYQTDSKETNSSLFTEVEIHKKLPKE